MQRRKTMNRALSIAALAILFGAGTTFAQSETGRDASGMSQQGQATPMDSGTSGASSGAAKSGAGKTMSKSDQDIMREMAQSNMAEVAAATIALQKSQNEQVKTFAQKMIDDHTQAQTELEQLAQARGVTLPTEPSSKQQAAAKQLQSLEGEKFDKQYLAQGGVKDHRETHRMLDRAESRAKDPELKALVAKMEPIVSSHMELAQDTQSSKGTASGSSGSSDAKGASGGSDSTKQDK